MTPVPNDPRVVIAMAITVAESRQRRPVPARRLSLAGVPFPGPWTHHGACLGCDPNMFFPTRGEDVLAAKRVCGGCPVLADCRAFAHAWPGLLGVWGATTAQERKAWRGARRRRLAS